MRTNLSKWAAAIATGLALQGLVVADESASASNVDRVAEYQQRLEDQKQVRADLKERQEAKAKAADSTDATTASKPPAGALDRREDVRDHRENIADRRENVRDRTENRSDRREDVRDRKEDVRDSKHDGGKADKAEDIRDKKEDGRDKKEDVRDRKEGLRDKLENKRDLRENLRDRLNAGPVGGNLGDRLPNRAGALNNAGNRPAGRAANQPGAAARGNNRPSGGRGGR